jgi:quercetin dioxygenase-like cupin family protein
MATHELVVLEDRLVAGEAALALGPANRIVYAVEGDVEVGGAAGAAALAPNAAWHGAGPCRLAARGAARAWRWELRRTPPELGPRSRVLLAQPVALPAADGHLMRCDRVDFPPGGVAYTHTHQGPGIRVLLGGAFRVETAGHATSIRPGEAWFESGPEPVYAEASREAPTSFVRVMVLPAALLGKSSIRYVKPEDQARPKTQTYTVFVDAPITA